MNSIRELWDSFEELCVPKGLSAERVVQDRRIFYAGAVGLFGLLIGKLEDPNVTEEQGERFIQELAAEANQFADDLESKRV